MLLLDKGYKVVIVWNIPTKRILTSHLAILILDFLLLKSAACEYQQDWLLVAHSPPGSLQYNGLYSQTFQIRWLLLSLNFHSILPTLIKTKGRKHARENRVDRKIKTKRQIAETRINKLNKLQGGEKLWGCWNFKWTGVMPSSLSVGVACCVIEEVFKNRETYWQLNINERFNVVEGSNLYHYSMLIRVRREKLCLCTAGSMQLYS